VVDPRVEPRLVQHHDARGTRRAVGGHAAGKCTPTSVLP
jgi:hypothetical protein